MPNEGCEVVPTDTDAGRDGVEQQLVPDPLPNPGFPLNDELAARATGLRVGDVADPEVARRNRGQNRLLRDVCALANAPRGRKVGALRRIRRNEDPSGALALLEAVEKAALPSLARDAVTGRFEVGRCKNGREKTVMPQGWHEAVFQNVGYVGVWGRIRSETHDGFAGKLVITLRTPNLSVWLVV